MRRVLTAIALTGILASCGTAQTNSTSEVNSNNTKMDHKVTVGTFLGAVMNNDPETMRKYANADYIQHNPFIPTGLEPFIQMLPVLQENGTTAENIRMFQDGNYVFMHNIWRNAKPFGADEAVSFDIIRLDDNGKVAEHWDAMTPLVKETASGRTQTDGPTTPTDLDKTDANKALAKAMVEDILMGKNPQKITDYISTEQYDQHNPGIKDGLAGIVEAVEYLTSQNNMFQYTKIHKVLGEGNFVLTISEGKWNGTTNVFYDLLRFENGKAVEHWDVIQEIPTENLANDNSMFNF
ncbi:nuclear transport factor 2 family protein [Phaeodactylibacter sp.]|uniref:nuclear transport factor 2 family protein n=1 Tax=Phaeodactylibacter sp. TaxID=1940289 RepID=UPI0025FB3ECF|nr:nuclear transport factor 2 family protein [Phaeodactylibacter sp.]MCI4650936.1 nuclear transport factor 2 family protein [Phaeodactylibacter sp.]MCI5092723.1 nuclear transport factor 2 family protein [Phaeodactylibacter sp.]